MIVVTPTFYVEDDCADDLDQLTYSFAKELRNDLMPEIESVYSTYANRQMMRDSQRAGITEHLPVCQEGR